MAETPLRESRLGLGLGQGLEWSRRHRLKFAQLFRRRRRLLLRLQSESLHDAHATLPIRQFESC